MGRRRKIFQFTQEDVEHIRRLRDQGTSVAGLSERFDCTKSTILRYISGKLKPRSSPCAP